MPIDNRARVSSLSRLAAGGIATAHQQWAIPSAPDLLAAHFHSRPPCRPKASLAVAVMDCGIFFIADRGRIRNSICHAAPTQNCIATWLHSICVSTPSCPARAAEVPLDSFVGHFPVFFGTIVRKTKHREYSFCN
jgi:hypothetical protein